MENTIGKEKGFLLFKGVSKTKRVIYIYVYENLGMICNDNEDDLEHPIEVFPRSFPRLLDGSEAYYSILKKPKLKTITE